MQGNGPLVILCHGFPELWISWREQLQALADAGFRAVAPDMRGYGGTTAPEDDAAYTLLHLVGDMVELVAQLESSGDRRAVYADGFTPIPAPTTITCFPIKCDIQTYFRQCRMRCRHAQQLAQTRNY